jgi:transcriptional regulator with GAF, ATPase, and Fis domain
MNPDRAKSGRPRPSLDTAADLLILDGLLDTLTEVLDVREVFERVSHLVQSVLPHDMLGILEVCENRDRVRVYVNAGESDAPRNYETEVPFPELMSKRWEFLILNDIPTNPAIRDSPVAKLGMVSGLCLPIRFGGQLQASVNFFSRKEGWFTEEDVPIARRIANHLALALSHFRLAEEARKFHIAEERAEKLDAQVRKLTDELDAHSGYRRIIDESRQWREVLQQAAKVAATETTVLLLGESGTGKEVVARFLHRASARHDEPFVAINCAALPEHLLESELFGYERGAFTGAMQSKPGLIEQAAGGVLFLDEVGEMALAAQAKFLRVLQEREFQRLGGTRTLKANVRVIAATNRDLRKAVEQKLFREDLYFRLNIFELRLPPLRDRRADIPLLCEVFLDEIGRSIGHPPAGISREAQQALTEYSWPGNVRELRNVLERAAILADGGLIVAEHLAILAPPVVMKAPLAFSPVSDDSPPRSADLKSIEREMIVQALVKARYSKSEAARALGLTRAQLYTRLKRHQLE